LIIDARLRLLPSNIFIGSILLFEILYWCMPEEEEGIFYHLKQWFKKWTLAIMSVIIGVAVLGISESISSTSFLTSFFKNLLTVLGIALITSVIVGISIESSLLGRMLDPWRKVFSDEIFDIINKALSPINKSFVFKTVQITVNLLEKGNGKYILKINRKYHILNTSRRKGTYPFGASTSTFYDRSSEEFEFTLDGSRKDVKTKVTKQPTGLTKRSLKYDIEFGGKEDRWAEVAFEEDAESKDFKLFAVPLATEHLELNFFHPENIRVSFESQLRKPKQKPNENPEKLQMENVLPYQFILAQWDIKKS